MAKRAFNAPSSDLFKFEPDEIVIPTEGAMADSRTDLEVLESLVLSIMSQGIIEPIVIGKGDDGRPFVIDGRQRVKAAREASKRLAAQGSKMQLRVPCTYRKADDLGAYLAMCSANEHRQEDSILDKARKLQRAIDLGATEEEAMLSFGISRGTVRNWLNLLNAGPELTKAIKGGVISATAAAQIADLPRDEQKTKLEELTADGQRPTVTRAAKVRRNVTPGPSTRVRSRKAIQTAMDKAPLVLKTMSGLDVLKWVLGEDDERLA